MADKPNLDANVVVEQTLNLLNAMLAADEKAGNELMAFRAEANAELAKTAVQVRLSPKGDKHAVGILGVINGLLTSLGGDRVGMLVDNDRCVSFARVPNPKK